MEDKSFALSGGFLIFGALLLLLLPLPWILAAVTAATVHELGHYGAIRLLRGRVTSLRVGAAGASMQLPAMGRGREVICSLAGPMAGLSLVLLARWLPRLALCAAVQTAFNLLPIFPLDGGRALEGGLSMVCPPPVCSRICRVVALCCKLAVWGLAAYCTFRCSLGILPAMLAVLLWIRAK